ncbi:MAG TPA: acetate kinase, partial [Gemmatimonadaceae bacterium]|nr:acetate kinase [Gemmatimonadaceae bacterium]
ENAPRIRADILSEFAWAGLQVDDARNAALVGGAEGRFSTDDSRLDAWVVPTDEELLIARDTCRIVGGTDGA